MQNVTRANQKRGKNDPQNNHIKAHIGRHISTPEAERH
jgi:hypothetical protein